MYASDGASMKTVLETITSFYEGNQDIPQHKQPNIIHVCGKYSIIRVRKKTTRRDGTQIPENTFCGQPDPSDSYALLLTILEVQVIAEGCKHLIYNYSDLLNNLPM